MEFKKSYELDPIKAQGGVWVTIDNDGTQICVARNNNPKYLKIINAKVRDRMAELKATVISDDDKERLTREAIAEGILLGWRGITDNGVEAPYTPEKAYEFFQRGPDFLELILREADRLSNFLIQWESNLTKNSVPSLPGS